MILPRALVEGARRSPAAARRRGATSRRPCRVGGALLLALGSAWLLLAASPGAAAPDPAAEERALRAALAELAAGCEPSLGREELAALAGRVRRRRQAAAGLPEASGLVLVMIDTLRADHLGGYGYPRPTSPFLDRLARRGIVLQQAFSPCPWTRPSMAGVLTSTYSGTHGVFQEKWDRLSSRLLLLSEILQACGFATLGVNSNPNLHASFGFAQGFDRYTDSDFLWRWMRGGEEGAGAAHRYPWDARRVGEEGLLLLASAVDSPFYLQLVYLDLHPPSRPPEEYVQSLGGGRYLARYDGALRFIDGHLQRLQRLLERAGRGDSWFVVFADHGEGLNDNNQSATNRGHGFDLYDTLLHVPVILHHPRLDSRLCGMRLPAVSRTLDLVPTLLDLLGFPPDLPGFAGRSLVPLLGDPQARRMGEEAVYAETVWHGTRKCALREGGWKLIVNEVLPPGSAVPPDPGWKLRGEVGGEVAVPSAGKVELYAVERCGFERLEENDLAGLHPQVVRNLRQRLEAWRQTNRPEAAREGEGEAAPPDEQTREALKALGYLE